MVLFFSVRGEGKCEINYKKKKKKISYFRDVFLSFLVVSLPEKMIRKYFGVRRRSRDKKNVILRKRCKARFLDIMGRKNGECVDR